MFVALTGASGGITRDHPRSSTIVRRYDVGVRRQRRSERDVSPDRKRPEHDAGSEDEQHEPCSEAAVMRPANAAERA